MPRGDKSKYTDKQERKADHIAQSYKSRGVSDQEAERRARATVNKDSGGGNKSGSGRGKPDTHVAAKKGGRIGGHASATRSAAARSASARRLRQRAGATPNSTRPNPVRRQRIVCPRDHAQHQGNGTKAGKALLAARQHESRQGFACAQQPWRRSPMNSNAARLSPHPTPHGGTRECSRLRTRFSAARSRFRPRSPTTAFCASEAISAGCSPGAADRCGPGFAGPRRAPSRLCRRCRRSRLPARDAGDHPGSPVVPPAVPIRPGSRRADVQRSLPDQR